MFDSASLLRNFNFARFSRLPHFLELSFGGTVTDENGLALMELAKSMKTATATSSHVTFDFRRSHLGEYREVLRSFCIEISGASAIHAIHVVGNAGRDDMRCLQLVLSSNTPLKSLALKETNFGVNEISMIKEFFCTNDKLEDLELCSNAFMDDIAIGSILEWVQKSGSNPKSLLISDQSVEENTASKLTDSIIFSVRNVLFAQHNETCLLFHITPSAPLISVTLMCKKYNQLGSNYVSFHFRRKLSNQTTYTRR
mmetsp:Transcript_4265/g.8437  ORF Transcript_4265/g.8437 Transcript_4265/m.8437 type:complete len:255 (+) Transcript_4265:105-869(+)